MMVSLSKDREDASEVQMICSEQERQAYAKSVECNEIKNDAQRDLDEVD
jgi:hypothetical protein